MDALKELGGSGTIEEINGKIIESLHLSDAQLAIPHSADGTDTRSEIEYRLAWARTYLKKYGALENSNRGVWALTQKGKEITKVDPINVKRFVNSRGKGTAKPSKAEVVQTPFEFSELQELTWRDELLKALRSMPSDAFERLTQRLLRESGFIQVEVTGRRGDGGIDGKGIMRIAGLLSFHVSFQCKRYKQSVTVGPDQIRDFRGAMVGRADKGLFITTGNFTKGAIEEATRDGASPIDLIDGDLLVDKLKELSLGVETKKIEVEQVTVNSDWFKTL